MNLIVICVINRHSPLHIMLNKDGYPRPFWSCLLIRQLKQSASFKGPNDVILLPVLLKVNIFQMFFFPHFFLSLISDVLFLLSDDICIFSDDICLFFLPLMMKSSHLFTRIAIIMMVIKNCSHHRYF